jgi:hypothetical protein
MAFYSTQRAVSDGTLVLLPISIEYFDRSEITVFFDELPTTEGVDWNWVGSTDHTLSFPSPGVPNGVEVLVARNTDISDVRHIFVDGAAFLDETMDENFRQILHVVQEAKERLGLSDIFNDLNMHGYRIRNIGTAVDDTDALSLAQYKADADGVWTAHAQAVVAKDAAVLAKTAAETAEANAELAETNAETAQGLAEDARDAAIVAKNAAEAASTNPYVIAVGSDLLGPNSEIETVATHIANVNLVGTNISDIQQVATNLAPILAAPEEADAAAASAAAALASENKANEWAEKTSGPVEGSEYSAKYWAEQAAASTSGQFYEGSNTVTVNKTIVNGKNAMTPGPITVANGPSVVVESGAVWTIV